MSIADLDLMGAEYVGGPAEDAIAAGNRDENKLTDMEFSVRHPERKGRPIQASEKELAKEWVNLRDSIVRPALRKLPTAPAAALAAETASMAAPASAAAPASTAPAAPAVDVSPVANVVSTFPWMPQIAVPSFTISPQAQAAPSIALLSPQAQPAQAERAAPAAPPSDEIPLGLKLGGGAALVYVAYRLLRKKAS